jgi:hypothetical protein
MSHHDEDTKAVHVDVSGELGGLTEKVSPVGADLIVIEDSEASGAKKKVQITNLPGGSGTDSNAVHVNVANEISTVTEKGTPVSADLIIIEDSAAAGVKKKVQIGNLPGGTDADAIHDNVSGEINAITEKGTPVSGDWLLIEDSASSNSKKKVQIGNLPGGSGTDADAIHDNVANEISAITEKSAPVGNDLLLIEDSEASGVKKKLKISNFPSSGGGGAQTVYFSDNSGSIYIYNTSSEESAMDAPSFGSKTLPALDPGQVIKVFWDGSFLANGSNKNFRIRLKIGTNELCNIHVLPDSGGESGNLILEASLSVHDGGASRFVQGIVKLSIDASTTGPYYMTEVVYNTLSGTDITAPAFDVTAQWDSGDYSNAIIGGSGAHIILFDPPA